MMSKSREPIGPLLWGTLPADKLVSIDLSDLPELDAADRASTEATLARALDRNPWAAALGAMGHRVEVTGRRMPLDEGETSLKARFHQGVLSLVPSARIGSDAVVLGSMAFGNHSLAHSLQGLARGFPDPDAALRALRRALVPSGPDQHLERCLAAPGMAKVRGELTKRRALREDRLFRFPGALFGAPDLDAITQLASDLELGPEVTRTLVSAREAMHGVGLGSYADFALVTRAALIRELAALLEIDARGHVPLSLEHLVMTMTGDLAGRPLSTWVAEHHAGLRTHVDPDADRGPTYGRRVYRVLNYFLMDRLVAESTKSIVGRGSEYGWSTMHAAFANGEITDDPAGLAAQPVADLLAAGYGLSGKLVYHAAGQLNGGRICTIVARTSSDAFSALLNRAAPNRILALGNAQLRGGQSMEFRSLNLYAGMDRVCRNRDPQRFAQVLFREFSILLAERDEDFPAVLVGSADSGQLGVWRNGAAREVF